MKHLHSNEKRIAAPPYSWVCPKCHNKNPPNSGKCAACSLPAHFTVAQLEGRSPLADSNLLPQFFAGFTVYGVSLACAVLINLASIALWYFVLLVGASFAQNPAIFLDMFIPYLAFAITMLIACGVAWRNGRRGGAIFLAVLPPILLCLWFFSPSH